MKSKKPIVSVTLPDTLLMDLDKACRELGMSRSALVERAILEWLKQYHRRKEVEAKKPVAEDFLLKKIRDISGEGWIPV